MIYILFPITVLLYQEIRTSIKSIDYHQSRSSFKGKRGTRGISSGVEESCYENLFHIVGTNCIYFEVEKVE